MRILNYPVFNIIISISFALHAAQVESKKQLLVPINSSLKKATLTTVSKDQRGGISSN